ncbi:SigB/SigF/SigG family RNA polymerase sigma factor [Nocardia sp. NPDC057030]|uniref:SigB/SigF/SigG family RNA polymerase sigma factor n=1 Tax=unclassified Nocardia TaxID=2637762 RepID=UPI003633D28E
MTETSTLTRARAPRTYRGTENYAALEPLFAELAALAEDDPRRTALRLDLITRALPLAEHIARRYAGRGENFDDLLQTARVGLVAAVGRYDPAYGASFVAFAVPTIMGEVRRHFRDYAWAVRVPRRLKDIQLSVGGAIDVLFQRLGRMPRASEIAAELGVDLADVTEAMIAHNSYRTSSIDAAAEGAGAGAALLDALNVEVPDYQAIENALAVEQLIAGLPERERQVVFMRFFEGRRQTQIAERLGISQMQVSRILSKALNSLREQVLHD